MLYAIVAITLILKRGRQVALSIKSRAPSRCDGRRFVQLEFRGEGDATVRRYPILHPFRAAAAPAHIGPHPERRGQSPRHVTGELSPDRDRGPPHSLHRDRG